MVSNITSHFTLILRGNSIGQVLDLFLNDHSAKIYALLTSTVNCLALNFNSYSIKKIIKKHSLLQYSELLVPTDKLKPSTWRETVWNGGENFQMGGGLVEQVD